MTKFKIIAAMLLGFPALLVPCFFHLWTEPNYPSIKPWPSGEAGVGPYRPLVRQWKWRWLNWWYMNTEDDISTDGAWVWDKSSPPKLIPYAWEFSRRTPQWVIALVWNAWRNNANNLKRPLRNDSLNKAWP